MALTYLVPAVYDSALSVFSFALPLYLLAMGVSPVVIGVLLAIPSSIQIFARIPAGLAAGKVGNIPAMLAGCGLMAAAGLLIANAPLSAVVTMVAAAQVCSGLGRACFWPANQAHLFEVAGDRIGRYIGPYNFVVTLGGMTGPLLAGLAIDRGGPDAAFWLLTALTVVASALLISGRRRTAAKLGHWPSPVVAPQGGFAQAAGAQVGRVIRSPGVWLAGLICVASVVPFTVTTSFYPVLLKNLGMSAASISLLATVRVGSVALFSLLTGPFVTPLRRPTLLAVAGLLGATGMALIPVLSGTGLSFLPMILFGLCGGAMHNVQMAVAGEAVAPADRALSMALVGSIGNVAMTATPLWHGWMADRGWLAEAFPWTGLLLAVVVISCFGWARRLARQAGAVAEPHEAPQP